MSRTTIEQTTLVKRKAGIVSSKLEDEVVMLDIEQGKYFGLDPIGARIWELIETPNTIQAIISSLTAEYNVGKEQCENDVFEFLNQMHSLSIIEYE